MVEKIMLFGTEAKALKTHELRYLQMQPFRCILENKLFWKYKKLSVPTFSEAPAEGVL